MGPPSGLGGLQHLGPSPEWFILTYSATGTALLAFRRRWPMLIFGALLVMTVPAYLLIDYYFPVLLLLVALAAVAQYRAILPSVVSLVLALVPGALFIRKAIAEASPDGQLAATVGSGTMILLVTMLAWVAGRWPRLERRRGRRLEQEHLDRQRQAITDERLAIARELHDIVAHAVTIMVLQAAGAKAIAPAEPPVSENSWAASRPPARKPWPRCADYSGFCAMTARRSATARTPAARCPDWPTSTDCSNRSGHRVPASPFRSTGTLNGST